jgi:hypothetical protein
MAHRRNTFFHFNVSVREWITDLCRFSHWDASLLCCFFATHEIIRTRPSRGLLLDLPGACLGWHRLWNDCVEKTWFFLRKLFIVINESFRLCRVPLGLICKIDIWTRSTKIKLDDATYSRFAPFTCLSFLCSVLYEWGPGFFFSLLNISWVKVIFLYTPKRPFYAIEFLRQSECDT